MLLSPNCVQYVSHLVSCCRCCYCYPDLVLRWTAVYGKNGLRQRPQVAAERRSLRYESAHPSPQLFDDGDTGINKTQDSRQQRLFLTNL